MSSQELVLEAEYAFVELRDAQTSEDADWDESADVVPYARGEECMLITCRQDLHGPVTVRFSNASNPPLPQPIFTGELRVPSGVLVAGSTFTDEWISKDVRPGVVSLSVYGDVPVAPSVIEIQVH